ncbi:MAG: protein-disulfide reductase DsbD [Pseudomonadota bacterium]
MRNLTTTTLLLILGLLSGMAHAQEIVPLKPEEAFRYAAVDTGSAIEVDWALEDGYYLYQSKLSFESGSGDIIFGNIELPTGLHHEDEFFGVQPVYRNRFFVTIPYASAGERPDSVDLVIKSQGCADIGICYPPEVWTTSVPLVAAAPVSTLGAAAPSSLSGLGGSEFLPVDEAFKLYVSAIDGNTAEVGFQVTEGHYLYKDKISVSAMSETARAGHLDLPAGEMKVDEFFGEVEVYHDDLFVKVPIARATPDALDLEIAVGYQGCADAGLCYPPQTRNFTLSLPQATTVSALPVAAAPVSEQGLLAQIITSSSIWTMAGVFFLAGLGLALTPCVLPMIPILSGIIAGEGDDVSAGRGFSLALSYVLGMAIVYTVAGIAAAAVGVQLQAIFNAPWVLTLFAGLFVVLAMSMFGMFELQMPSAVQTRLAALSGEQKGGTVVGAFIMGALSSLIVTACVAPPLVAALTVIGQTGDMVRGGAALFAMSIGMGAPLLLVGASAGQLLPKVGPWMEAVKTGFGFMMLGLAIWMLSRILPETLTLALWGVLVLMAGVFLGGLTNITSDATGAQKLGKGFGLIAVLYGSVMLLGSLAGGTDPLRPLASVVVGTGGGAATAEHELEFVHIKSVADLDREIAAAAASGKTAMLDFYEDWCVSCKEMEKYTFTDPQVHDALDDTVLLQADVTANDELDQELLAHFGVFGPPTIIFFGTDGLPRDGYEVVGYMKAKDFATHVGQAFGAATSLTAQR